MRSTLLIIMLDFFVSSLMLFISVEGNGSSSSDYFGNGKPLSEIRQQAKLEESQQDLQIEVDTYFDKIYNDLSIQSVSQQLAKENKDLMRENKVLSDDKALSKNSIDEKDKVNKELAQSNSELRNKNISLEQALYANEESLAQLSTEHKKIASENFILRDSNKLLSDNLQAREEELSNVKKARDDLQEHANKIASSNTKLEQQYKDVRDEKDEVQNKLHEEQARRQTSENENNNLKIMLKDKESEIERLKAENSKKLDELRLGQQEVKSRQEEMQAGIKRVEQQGDELKRDTSNIKRDTSEKLDELKIGQQEVKNQQEEMQAGIRRVEQQGDDLKRDTSDIKRDTSEIKSALAEIQKSLQQQTQERAESYKKWQEDSREFIAQISEQNKLEEKKVLEQLISEVNVAKDKVEQASQALQSALATGIEEKIQEAVQQYQQANDTYRDTKQNAAAYGNDNSVPAEAIDFAASRVELTFDLADKDYFTNSKTFNSYGISVADASGAKCVLIHQQQLGLSWGEYDDGLKRADLRSRTHGMRSAVVTSFSSLANNRSLIRMNISGVTSAIPLYRSTDDIPKYRPNWSKNLTIYAADKKHSPKSIDEEVDVQSNQLKFGGRLNQYEFSSAFSKGDFVLDEHQHLICVMVSPNECRFITQQDLEYTSDDFYLGGDLNSFASQVLEYQREIR